MNTKVKVLMPYLSFCLMTLAVTLMLNCGKDKNENPPPPPPPPTVYSNATLTGTWMMKLNTGVDIVTTGLKFDGNGNIVETEVAENPLHPTIYPAPYDVHSNGSFTITITNSGEPPMIFTGILTSATTGSVTAVDSTPVVSGKLKKISDLGACQGTWTGKLSGPFSNSFTIDVDNTGTITGGSGFTAPYIGKLFCESGDATGSLGTGSTAPLDWIKFQTGTVVSGATVTISGNYETNGPGATYALVRPPYTPPIIVKGTSGNDVNMNGVWTSCSPYKAYQQDEKDTLTINGSSGTFVAQMWSAAVTSNCTQTATPDMVFNASYSITTGATGTAIWMNGNTPVSPPAGIPANAQATSAVLNVSSYTVTLQSDAYVANANTQNICGGGWVKNVARDVLNCTDYLPGGPTVPDYWVIDDSATPLTWYSNMDGVAWHVDISSFLTK